MADYIVRDVRLLIATTNPGKVREIRLLLGGLAIRLLTLADLPPVPEPDETGETFAANARLKATYYATAFGITTVGEDSGLEIDALGGQPGVRSARYPGATYPDKFQNLYRELAPYPRPWTARYVSAVALRERQALGDGHWALGDQAPGTRHWALGTSTSAQGPAPSAYESQPLAFECTGTVDGEIAPSPRGTNGFGYDPIFFYPPYGATFGEVDDARKLAVAHRGVAFRKLAEWLRRLPLPRESQQ